MIRERKWREKGKWTAEKASKSGEGADLECLTEYTHEDDGLDGTADGGRRTADGTAVADTAGGTPEYERSRETRLET